MCMWRTTAVKLNFYIEGSLSRCHVRKIIVYLCVDVWNEICKQSNIFFLTKLSTKWHPDAVKAKRLRQHVISEIQSPKLSNGSHAYNIILLRRINRLTVTTCGQSTRTYWKETQNYSKQFIEGTRFKKKLEQNWPSYGKSQDKFSSAERVNC